MDCRRRSKAPTTTLFPMKSNKAAATIKEIFPVGLASCKLAYFPGTGCIINQATQRQLSAGLTATAFPSWRQAIYLFWGCVHGGGEERGEERGRKGMVGGLLHFFYLFTFFKTFFLLFFFLSLSLFLPRRVHGGFPPLSTRHLAHLAV